MTWFYNDRPVTNEDLEGQYGFVYLIENLLSGKRYIGKKVLFFKKFRTVKGKKKRYLADSDWLTYYGSNRILLEDIEANGVENFKRTVLRWCKTKGEANYYEAKMQFEKNVLLDSNYYNDQIRVRIHSSHIKNEKEDQAK
jgi:hypothetical protein